MPPAITKHFFSINICIMLLFQFLSINLDLTNATSITVTAAELEWCLSHLITAKSPRQNSSLVNSSSVRIQS